MKIEVNGHEYEVKSNVRAMMVYEGITDKPFQIQTITDFYTYCFSMVYANNSENVPEFDEFLAWFDDDPSLTEKFGEAMQTKKPLETKGKKKVTEKSKG